MLPKGKSEKSCRFRGAILPKECVYRSNKRATSAKQWEVLFLVDTCPSPAKIENLHSITVEFLLPYSTYVLQPMDQGPIILSKRPERLSPAHAASL